MRNQFKNLRWWSLLKLFEEENEPLLLEIRSLLKSKLEKKWNRNLTYKNCH